MLKFTYLDRHSGDLIEANPTACFFGLTEIAAPMIVGLLTSAGVGAGTAGTLASIAAPGLIQAGVGAGIGALTGNPGMGAALGGLNGVMGPLSSALGMGTPGPTAGQNLFGSAGAGAQSAGNAMQQMGAAGAAFGGAPGATAPAAGGAGAATNPLAAFGAKAGSSGLSGPLAILAALAQNANRPPTTAPAAATSNIQFNTAMTGALNRAPTNAGPATGSYYNYGAQAEPQFFSGNQLHFAHGGALSRAIAAGHYAGGGALNHEFSTGGGDNYVEGDGDGQSDQVPARLSDGEYVLTAADVSRIGQGSTDAGAKKLDEMRKQLAKDAGAKQIQPKVKPPISYLHRAA